MAPSRKKTSVPALSSSSDSVFSAIHLLYLIVGVIIASFAFLFFKENRNLENYYTQYFPRFSKNVGLSSSPMAFPLFSRGNDVLSDPYIPPLKDDIFMASQMPVMIDVRGSVPILPPKTLVPVNIPSRGMESPYTQIGILNRTDGKDDLILPLMGKPASNGRDKYNYYTISNTGNVNTKLPVRVNGKNGVSEYGVDEIMSGDNVIVDGYNAPFRTTIYDNAQFRYLPVL
jgi:hypothetical protein